MTKEEAIKRVCKMIKDRQKSDKGPFFAIEDIAEAFVEFAVKDLKMLPPFNEDIEESPVGYGAAYLSDEEVRKRYCRHFCKWDESDD